MIGFTSEFETSFSRYRSRFGKKKFSFRVSEVSRTVRAIGRLLMVLEHLEIVGTAIATGIVDLGNDRDPPIKADTAQVKPKGARSAEEILSRYQNLRMNLLPSIDLRVKSFDSF